MTDYTENECIKKLQRIIDQPLSSPLNTVNSFLLDPIYVFNVFIEPELARRKQNGVSIGKGSRFFKALIRFPEDGPAIIDINDEVSFESTARTVPFKRFNNPSENVYLYDIQNILKVESPKLNGRDVAFVYIHLIGDKFLTFGNFNPRMSNESMTIDNETSISLEEAFTALHKLIFEEQNIQFYEENRLLLNKIGLWPAPALIPYPLNKVTFQMSQGDINGARQTLISFCTTDLIRKLSSNWLGNSHFLLRKRPFEEAVFAHQEGKYVLSIHALLPQLEGIITDWLYARSQKDNIPWRQESKTKKFRDLISEKQMSYYSFQRIIDLTLDFIISGPVLSTFKQWTMSVDNTFPNRNIVEHGKYEDSVYTEENSIKLFLLLDTIYDIISAEK
jgi:hypothetical protein